LALMTSPMKSAVIIVACGLAIVLGLLGGSFAANGHHLSYSPDLVAFGAVTFGAVAGGVMRRRRHA
jgi:hypothetical protein